MSGTVKALWGYMKMSLPSYDIHVAVSDVTLGLNSLRDEAFSQNKPTSHTHSLALHAVILPLLFYHALAHVTQCNTAYTTSQTNVPFRHISTYSAVLNKIVVHFGEKGLV